MKHASQATVLLRRWWLQIVAVLLGISAGLLFSALKEPVYTAEAYVVVVADDKSNIEQATNFAQAFARIVTQPGIIGAAVRPGLPAQTVDQLQQVVRVSASPDAPLIRLGASSAQPAHAAIQANAVAQALISYANLHAADTGCASRTCRPPRRPVSRRRRTWASTWRWARRPAACSARCSSSSRRRASAARRSTPAPRENTW